MIELTDDEFKILYDLARRTLHTAYVLNDLMHNNDPTRTCKLTCKEHGINNVDEGNTFLEKIAANDTKGN